MSTSYSNYIGPIILIEPKPRTIITPKSNQCPRCTPGTPINVRPPAKNKPKFCSECGEPIKDFDIQEIKEPVIENWEKFESIFGRDSGLMRLYEEFKPDGLPDNIIVIIPEDAETIDGKELNLIPLGGIDHDQLIKGFKSEYSNALDKAKAIFGPENVKVIYGFCNWWG